MKVLSSHKFENDKEIRVVRLTADDQKRLDVPECDVLGMAFRRDGRWKWLCFRPDEAVLMIRLLSEGLFESVQGYSLGK
jgi:hypothetical protein